tara:strand:- start:132 stop:359 length:228 start_codon:yes stop_codon:yes gene_type:complete
MSGFLRFVIWFTLIPWVIYTLRAPFVMWLDFEMRFGFLGLIAYVALWIFAWWLLGPISVFIGFIHSWAWVSHGEA